MLPIDINIFPQQMGAYLVGGSIRDLLSGRDPVDYDLAVAQDPAGFARSLASKTSGHLVEFGRHGHAILRVVTPESIFDITPLYGDSIEVDLRRRDFTINAMALDLASGNLVDPLGGREDMAAGIIRMVSVEAFRDDPVRLIRAYRMAAAFGFSIDISTAAAIRRDADLIHRSAGERVREELFKIFSSVRSHAQLMHMADSGLLFGILPELRQLRDCRPTRRSAANFFEQTLCAYDFLENLLASRALNLSAAAAQLYETMSAKRAALLKWAVLLHDIGRPAYRQLETGGSHHFLGCAAKSAAMAGKICRRLRWPRRQSNTLEFIIRNHLRPISLFKARQKHIPVERAFIRLFIKTGTCTSDILLHALAEFEARRTLGRAMHPGFVEFITGCIETFYSVLLPRASRPLPLTGADLITEFRLSPSAEFKRILKTIEEENLARPFFSRQQALEMVKKQLKEASS